MAEIINEIGKKYGKLTVIERVPPPNPKRTNAYYKCICECGNETIVSGTSLRNNETKSCGCLRKETNKKIPDHIGEVFGKLTIVNYDKFKNGKHYYNCLCECGNLISTSYSNLKYGKSSSCVKCRS